MSGPPPIKYATLKKLRVFPCYRCERIHTLGKPPNWRHGKVRCANTDCGRKMWEWRGQYGVERLDCVEKWQQPVNKDIATHSEETKRKNSAAHGGDGTRKRQKRRVLNVV